jgi:glycerol-3-phosphate cytidylyltransferase
LPGAGEFAAVAGCEGEIMTNSKKNITKDQIIGYTSGVFDMFHLGHLNILKRAKSLCDRLIVGVTTDELVCYKNAEAAVPFEERLEIVQNVKCVDLAVPQDDLDKYVMWEKLKFDVMFIGDDWFDTERFKQFEEKLATVGVKIIYLPYTKGVSTSERKKRRELRKEDKQK